MNTNPPLPVAEDQQDLRSSDTIKDADCPTHHAATPKPLSRGRPADKPTVYPWERFKVIRTIGAGQNGRVLEVEDTALLRRLAMKLPKSVDGVNPKRFVREARATASLQHPNIVPVHDFGVWRKKTFLTLDLVTGGDLASHLKNGPMIAVEAVQLLIPIAEAVQYAHDKNLLHRDIKPSNLLFKYKYLVLTDFGFATWMGVTSSLGTTVAGTPAYMSPEQAASLPTVDGRTDIYSIGATLYQMLTGQTLLEGERDLLKAIKRIRSHSEWPPPSQLRPDLPRELDAICQKCLRKKRKDRYPTASDLIADFRQFLDGRASRPSA